MDMDDRAAKNTGDTRAEFLSLAKGWRYAAKMAQWQDTWEMYDVIEVTRH